MNRIDLKFKELKMQGEKALIPFVTAGDPSLEATVDIVLEMDRRGADVVEIGIPYSDPLADGPIIQGSSQRAIEKGAKIKNIMEVVKKIRDKSNVPLVYLVYYSSIFKYGLEKFISEASTSGIDGIIIPDLPIEERGDIIDIAGKYGVYLIPLVAPTSQKRIKEIAGGGSGFVYCVSKNGVTGVGEQIKTNIEEYMELVGNYTELPKAIGFGITGPDMAREFKPYCDGIIIGSAIIDIIYKCKDEKEAVNKVGVFISAVKKSLDE
ncbi:tryptophan synthase subunit alpha [Clostridium sp. WILCCON 0269]|uniref:Tryptophan synthase alpha chain n=1 Tax=Candidatus Clostridium eludens TaxID=3381663 RepID=A0ABW8SMC1_9CLOT